MYAHRLGGISGLGEVDGFWKDVGKSLKVFGQSTIRVATAGMYDPSKNRFLVPFTGAQVRNAAAGTVGVVTGGWVGSGAKVNTDKFMNSGTGKILGNIGAAAQAAIVGGAAMNYFSTPAVTTAPSTVNVAPAAYASSVPSASSLAPAAFADPTPMMSSLGPSGWSGGAIVPAAPITAPTASFASIPTSANAFAAPAFGPAPALLQPFGVEAGAGGGWPSSSWLPSGDTIAKSAMTALTVADTASRILGRAASMQTGGTVVNASDGGQLMPTAYPTPYMPGSGGGGGGNYEEPIAGGDSMMPWLAVGGIVAVVGYLYIKKK